MNVNAWFPAGRRCRGFTLVELIVSIVLAGILSIFTVQFVSTTILGYTDLARRTALVDAAESALRRIGRDVRQALPNSVRVTDTAANVSFALEMIPILDGGKYNAKIGAATAKLDFNNDTDFDLFGTFSNPATLTTSGIRIVINNRGTTGNDVYEDAGGGSGVEGVITSTATTITISTSGSNHHVNLSPSYDFKGGVASNQRLYVVTTSVSYLCDATLGTLVRYSGYAIPSSQPTSPGVAPLATATSALIVDKVSACRVYSTTSDVRNTGLVTLALTLADSGETVRLIHQVQLDNSR